MDVFISETTISVAIAGFQYSLKRVTKRCEAASTEQNIQKRMQYSEWIVNDAIVDQLPIIYFDEVGFQLTCRRIYGRSAKNTRAIVKVPTIRSRNITVMAAITSSQLLYFKILESNGNTESMLTFINELAESIQENNLPERSIIVMDNAR